MRQALVEHRGKLARLGAAALGGLALAVACGSDDNAKKKAYPGNGFGGESPTAAGQGGIAAGPSDALSGAAPMRGDAGAGNHGDAGAGVGGDATASHGGAGGESPLSCPIGLGDCDDVESDCETDLTLVTSCGACDVACVSNHAKVTCDAQQLKCVFAGASTCDDGYGDCDDDAATGCETALGSDAGNCGRCARSCGTAACTAGACGAEEVLKPPGGGHYNYYVYSRIFGDWLLYVYEGTQDSELRSVRLPLAEAGTAGNLIQSATVGASQIRGVTSDGKAVYFATTAKPYTVYQKPLNGSGSAVAVFDAPSPANTLMLNATAFYFVAGNAFYTIAKVPGNSIPVTVPGLDGRGAIHDAILVGNQLLWIESVGDVNQLFRSPVGGGTAVLLDAAVVRANQTRYATLATDGTYVYYNCSEAGELRRVPINGAAGDVKKVFSTASPMYPAVAGKYLYFNNDYGGKPQRVLKDGSDPFTVTDAVDNYSGYESHISVVSDGFLYDNFSGAGMSADGQILRHALK